MNFTANGAVNDSNNSDTNHFGVANEWFAATSRTTNGYQVELVIKKSALRNPADGATLSFDVAQNDDDNADVTDRLQPKTYSLWSGHAFQPFSSGQLVLLGTGGSIPAVVTNITITGVKMTGNNLQLTFTTPKPSSAYAVEQ